MKKRFLITLCCVLFLSDQVVAGAENEIKRGKYSYMAFLYYSDESVIEASGQRFLRGAVLIKPDWLITSSVGPMTINDVPLGFPRKTLLARLGAVTIDNKFALSEDEGEQEREVIQIVRPYNQSATQWWRTDITLLKTLLPFNITATVRTGTLRTTPLVNVTDCFMLIYSRQTGNWSEDRQLMQLYVEVMPPKSQNCGSHYHEDTMLCAIDNEESKIVNDTKFCQGNSGGPLVCENKITGIQTYVENNCMQPHFYQHLLAWNNFISCGIGNKCNEEQCSNMCTVINKDEDISKYGNTNSDEQTDVETNSLFTLTEEITMPSPTNDVMRYEDLFAASTTLATTTAPSTTTEEPSITDEPTTSTTTSTTTTLPTTTTSTSTQTETETTKSRSKKTSWPKEKYPQRANLVETDDNNIERKANVEAQRQDVKVKAKGTAQRNLCYIQSLLFSVFILACVI